MFKFNKAQLILDMREKGSLVLQKVYTLVGMLVSTIWRISLITVGFAVVAIVFKMAAEKGIDPFEQMESVFPFALVAFLVVTMVKLWFNSLKDDEPVNAFGFQVGIGSQLGGFDSAEQRANVIKHEVGHAICHLAYLWPIESLHIHCKRKIGRETTLNGQAYSVSVGKDDTTMESALANMKISLGGSLAERLYGDGIERVGSDGDLISFEALAREYLNHVANLDKSIVWFYSPTNELELTANKAKMADLQVALEAQVLELLQDNKHLMTDLCDKLDAKKELVFKGKPLQDLRNSLVIRDGKNV